MCILYCYIFIGFAFAVFSYTAQTLAPRKQVLSHLIVGLIWPVLLLVAPGDLLGITRLRDAKNEQNTRKEDSEWLRGIEKGFNLIRRSMTQLSPLDCIRVQESIKDVSVNDILSFERMEALEVALNKFWKGGETLAAAYDSHVKLKEETARLGLSFNFSKPDLSIEFPRSFSKSIFDLPVNRRKALLAGIHAVNDAVNQGAYDILNLKVWGAESLAIYPVETFAMVIMPNRWHSRVFILAILDENPYASPSG